MDLRQKKTQEKLHKALLELFTTYTYKDISISDICDKADIKRPTFYNHYKDKEDFVEKAMYDQFLKVIDESSLKETSSFKDFFITLIEGYLKDLEPYKSNIINLYKDNEPKQLTIILYKTLYKILYEKLTSLYPYVINKSLIETFLDSYCGMFMVLTSKFLTREDYSLDILIKNLKEIFSSTTLDKSFKK